MSAGPADAAGACIVLVTSPEIQCFLNGLLAGDFSFRPLHCEFKKKDLKLKIDARGSILVGPLGVTTKDGSENRLYLCIGASGDPT